MARDASFWAVLSPADSPPWGSDRVAGTAARTAGCCTKGRELHRITIAPTNTPYVVFFIACSLITNHFNIFCLLLKKIFTILSTNTHTVMWEQQNQVNQLLSFPENAHHPDGDGFVHSASEIIT
jgi:hypothetical protein